MNTMERVREHHEIAKSVFPEDLIVGVFLYGSQNYGMDDELSDVDTKCIFVPSFDDLVFPLPLHNREEVLENNEHITFTDIRNFVRSIRLCDTTFIEVMFTKYFVLGPMFQGLWRDFASHRAEFAYYNPAGFVNVGYRDMQAVLKRQENTAYNPKLAAMVKRYEFLARDYLAKAELESLYCPKEHEWLLQVKRGKCDIEDGMAMQREAVENLRKYSEITKDLEGKLDTFVQEMLENYQRAFIWEQIKKEKLK